ncbi:MAG: hypothetical protein WCV63_11080 [Negativicutes bacterium]|jgi:hypothetical protein
MNYFYQIYGVQIMSALRFPGIPEENTRTVEASISIGAVPLTLPDRFAHGYKFQIADERFLLAIDNIARFYIVNGREIIIAPEAVAEETDIALFVLSSVMPVLLQQRGQLVLHGAAFEYNGRGIMVCGPPGCGKTTLMAALAQNGYKILTSGFGIVDCSAKAQPLIMPGYPYLKLWRYSLTMLDLDNAGFERLRNGLERYLLPLGDKYYAKPLVLDKIYFIDNVVAANVGIDNIEQKEAAMLLIGNSYRYNFFASEAMEYGHRKLCDRVVDRVSLRKINKQRRKLSLQELLAVLEGDLNR